MQKHSIGTKLDGPTFERFVKRASQENSSYSSIVFRAVTQYLDGITVSRSTKSDGDERLYGAVQGLIKTITHRHDQILTELAKNRLLCSEILRHLSPDALNALEKEFEDFARSKAQSNNGAGRGQTPIQKAQNGAQKPDPKTAVPADIHAHDTLETDEELAR